MYQALSPSGRARSWQPHTRKAPRPMLVLIALLGAIYLVLYLRNNSFFSQSIPNIKHCTSQELIKLTSKPELWRITTEGEGRFSIQPDATKTSQFSQAEVSECLSYAHFEARLVSEHTIFALARPILSSVVPLPVYNVFIDGYQSAALPPGEYKLQVKLDFGFLMGAELGIVCGDESGVCSKGDMKRVAQASGGQNNRIYVGTLLSDTPSLSLDGARYILPSRAPACTQYNDLTGYWSKSGKNLDSFHPIASGNACEFPNVTFPLTSTRLSSKLPISSTNPVWINIVGDSNPRNLYPQLTNLGGSSLKQTAIQLASPTSGRHNGTIGLATFSSNTGQLNRHSSEAPNIIITWAWWFHSVPGSEMDESSLERLEKLVKTNFGEYMSTLGFDPYGKNNAAEHWEKYDTLKSIANTLTPSKTYIALGSHSESYMVDGYLRGLEEVVERLRWDHIEGSNKAEEWSGWKDVEFFTVTEVNSSHIPLDRFPYQDIVRNNLIIEARNRALRQFKTSSIANFAWVPNWATDHVAKIHKTLDRSDTRLNVFDAEALTRGIGDYTKKIEISDKQGKIIHIKEDAVHFVREVYSEWGRGVWGQLFG